MKSLLRSLPAACLALALTLTLVLVPALTPAMAQTAAPAAKPATAAAIASAKEFLALKNAGAMYADAVPNIVQQTKDVLLQNNLNYQKDLNEVAVIVAQGMAGREKWGFGYSSQMGIDNPVAAIGDKNVAVLALSDPHLPGIAAFRKCQAHGALRRCQAERNHFDWQRKAAENFDPF